MFVNIYTCFPPLSMNGGGRANDPAFSVDLTRSRAIFRDPEILYIIRGNRCTSQGDPDSSFPYRHVVDMKLDFAVTIHSGCDVTGCEPVIGCESVTYSNGR